MKKLIFDSSGARLGLQIGRAKRLDNGSKGTLVATVQ